MKLYRVVLVIITVVFAQNTFAVGGRVTGEVKKLRMHQYLDNSAWDNHAWFCLSDTTKIGSCLTSSEAPCNGAMALTLSKNDKKEMIAAVLSAQMARVSISVSVDDNYSLQGHCYARSIDVNIP